jgi:hypothetical protein
MPRQKRANLCTKRRLLIALTALLSAYSVASLLKRPTCRIALVTPVVNENGPPGRAPMKRRGQAKRVWRSFVDAPDREAVDAQFRARTLMSMAQFEALVQELEPVQEQIRGVATMFTFADKLLLMFCWLVEYPLYSALAAEFGGTITGISDLLREALPALAQHFTRYLSNEPSAVRKTEQLVSVMGGIRDSRNRQDVMRLMLDERGRIDSFVMQTTPLDRSVTSTKEGKRSPATSFLTRCGALSAGRRAQQRGEKRIACIYILTGWYNWLASHND